MSLPQQTTCSPAEFLYDLQSVFGDRGEIRIDAVLADSIREVLRHAVISVQIMEEYLATVPAPPSPPPVGRLRTAAERKALARSTAMINGNLALFPVACRLRDIHTPETGGAA